MALVAVGVAALAESLSFDAPEAFWRRKGELESVEVEPVGADSLYAAYRLTLVSSAGYAVRGHLRVPVGGRGPYPAVVIIGGVETGRMAAELFTPPTPYVILGLDYPWDGPTRLSAWGFLRRVLKIRRAMLLTPSAVMLAADYLADRPDVDVGRLVFAGASFGAQLIAVAGALDPRARTVLIVYGGGDYAELARANLKVGPRWLRSALARAAAWLLAPIEPLDYVGRIAPRRTVMINGRDDERIPRTSVEALYAAAREPKQLIWLDEGHIRPRDRELLERVLRAACDALDGRAGAGTKSPGPSGGVGE